MGFGTGLKGFGFEFGKIWNLEGWNGSGKWKEFLGCWAGFLDRLGRHWAETHACDLRQSVLEMPTGLAGWAEVGWGGSCCEMPTGLAGWASRRPASAHTDSVWPVRENRSSLCCASAGGGARRESGRHEARTVRWTRWKWARVPHGSRHLIIYTHESRLQEICTCHTSYNRILGFYL
jgi:hypothetical protein